MAAAETKSPTFAIEPRYSRTMPWVLVALGLALAIWTLASHTKQHVASTVTTSKAVPSPKTTTGAHSANKPEAKHSAKMVAARHGPKKAAAKQGVAHGQQTRPKGQQAKSTPPTPVVHHPPPLEPTSSILTRNGLSDTMFGTLMGIAGVLILLGAFYARIKDVTIAGNTIGMGPETPGTTAQDATAIATAVGDKVIDELRSQGRISGETISADEAKEIAQKTAVVAAETQQQVAQLRRTASAIAPAPAPAVRVEPAELSALSSGEAFPEGLLSRLAERAVKDKLVEDEPDPQAGPGQG